MVQDDATTGKTTKTNKPFSKLVEDAVLALKEVEQQLKDPFVKSKCQIAFSDDVNLFLKVNAITNE